MPRRVRATTYTSRAWALLRDLPSVDQPHCRAEMQLRCGSLGWVMRALPPLALLVGLHLSAFRGGCVPQYLVGHVYEGAAPVPDGAYVWQCVARPVLAAGMCRVG